MKKKTYAVSEITLKLGDKIFLPNQQIEVTKNEIKEIKKTNTYLKGKITLS